MNEILISILSSIGGTTVILGGLFGWLGQRYLAKQLENERAANRANLAEIQRDFAKEIESHKNQLAYDATFFNNLFDASNSLYVITQNVLPKRSYPDMCWDEACEEIALSFEEIEKELDDYLKKYFTPLPPDIVESIHLAISNCSEGKFETSREAASRKGIKLAGELFEILNSTSIKLKSFVDEKRNVNSAINFKK